MARASNGRSGDRAGVAPSGPLKVTGPRTSGSMLGGGVDFPYLFLRAKAACAKLRGYAASERLGRASGFYRLLLAFLFVLF